jgi:hypothetical protein
MLLLEPQSVRFGSVSFESVQFIALDRNASRLVIERGDDGGLPIFADAPEELIAIRVVQQITSQELTMLRCGTLETLSWVTAASASDARRARMSTTAVLRQVRHEFPGARPSSRGAGTITRTLSFVAISPDGHSEPVAITELDAQP